MVLLEKIPLTNRARNAEHDYLFDKIVNSIPLAFATEHNFQAYHTRMTDALAEEHRSYTQTTKSVDTATLIDKDAVRDKRYRRLKLTVEAAELDADAETAASGAKCLIAFGTANLAALPYAEETAAVRDLVEKLESDEYATHVEAIGATQALADLKAANDDFDATYSGRAAERYARDTATLSTKEARVAMEKAYYEVMDILNAIYIQSAILVQGDGGRHQRPHRPVHAQPGAPRRRLGHRAGGRGDYRPLGDARPGAARTHRPGGAGRGNRVARRNLTGGDDVAKGSDSPCIFGAEWLPLPSNLFLIN